MSAAQYLCPGAGLLGAPAPLEPRTPIQDIARNAQQILDIFTANGYALKVRLCVFPACVAAATLHMCNTCPHVLQRYLRSSFKLSLLD